MLGYDEIEAIGNQQNKPAGMIDKDYAMEWLLYGIYRKDSKIRDMLIFKGGTALRKVYFPHKWRFSDDLDFTVLPDSNSKDIVSGFDEVCDILKKECGMEYQCKINVPSHDNALFGHVRFTGPIGIKNKIKIDMTRAEKIIDPPDTRMITAIYADLKDFPVNCYTINEIATEKICAAMQRIKVRDFYDIWKLFQKDCPYKFDTKLLVEMVRKKCANNNRTYDPEKIFEPDRLDQLREYWCRELEKIAIEELPDIEGVFDDLRRILGFLLRI